MFDGFVLQNCFSLTLSTDAHTVTYCSVLFLLTLFEAKRCNVIGFVKFITAFKVFLFPWICKQKF